MPHNVHRVSAVNLDPHKNIWFVVFFLGPDAANVPNFQSSVIEPPKRTNWLIDVFFLRNIANNWYRDD